MNLLTTEKIIWTVPAPNWARRKLRELKALPDSPKNEKARADLEAELPKLTQYRLTLSSVTMREETQRESVLADVRKWFEDTYGIGAYQYNQWFLDTHIRQVESKIDYPKGKELSRAEANEGYGILRDIANWATLMVCLRLVEKRQVPMHDPESGDEWQEVEIPAEWKSYHTFIDVFPRPLFNQATVICDDLNPGVWVTQMDDDSKNVGGVNVRG